MKLVVAGAMAAAALMAPVAEAHTQFENKYLHVYWKTVRQIDRRAPGRNIVTRGVRTTHGVVKASKHQIAESIRQMKRLLAPAPRMLARTAVPPVQPPAQVRTAGVTAGGTLSAIAACESGGNPGAISANGLYRGKYQFDYKTWASVGGTGDPAAASEGEQDRRAAALYSQRGAAPWPVCGR